MGNATVRLGWFVLVLILALLSVACGTEQGVSGDSEEPEERTARESSGSSETASAVPEYRVVNEEDFPIEDADGPIPAKSLVVQTEESSDSALREMAEAIKDEYPDEDIVGMNFGDFLDTEFRTRDADFVVMVRDGRAARAMGLTDEEFEDGGIAVNPEGAERATRGQYGRGQYGRDEARQQEPVAEEEGGVGVATIEVSGTEGLRFEGFLSSLESSRSVEGTVPETYEIEYETGLFAFDYISANFNKAITQYPQPGTLRVEIVVDGEVVNHAETSAEYGTASASWDATSN